MNRSSGNQFQARNRNSGPVSIYKPQFVTTRSVLQALIILSWLLLALGVFLVLYSGLTSYGGLGESLYIAVVGGIFGAVLIAVFSAIFVGIICLIDLRNIAAEQHFGASAVQPVSRHNDRPGSYAGDLPHVEIDSRR